MLSSRCRRNNTTETMLRHWHAIYYLLRDTRAPAKPLGVQNKHQVLQVTRACRRTPRRTHPQRGNASPSDRVMGVGSPTGGEGFGTDCAKTKLGEIRFSAPIFYHKTKPNHTRLSPSEGKYIKKSSHNTGP